MRYRQIVRFASETVWAVLPSTLWTIRELLALHVAGVKLDRAEIEARIVNGRARPDAASNGGVAIVPLWGVLVPHAGVMVDVSTPGTGLDQWQQQFLAAVNDPAVETVVLQVNSPGGSAQGVTETAKIVRDARSKKRIVAVADGLAASAAFAIASQAEQFLATPSGMVGAVHAYSIHEDLSGALEQEGARLTLIGAPDGGAAEAPPFLPLSDENRQHMQRIVDQFYERFVADVAKGRGTDASTVEASYGRGRVLTSRDALAAGMIDGIGTVEETVARLVAGKEPLARGTRQELEPAMFSLAGIDLPFGPQFFDLSVFAAGASGTSSTTSMTLDVVQGPIPPRSTEVVDEPWDGPGMVAICPAERGPLRALHAWVDSEADPATKEAYKFPHHMVTDGSVGAANVNGVRNALARLPGSSIPDADKPGVERHLQRHLDDFNQQDSASQQAVTPAAVGGITTRTGGSTMETVTIDGPTTVEEWAARQTHFRQEMDDLVAQASGRAFTIDEQTRFDELEAEILGIQATIDNIRDRDSRRAALAGKPEQRVSGVGIPAQFGGVFSNVGRRGPDDIFDLAAYRTHARSVDDLVPLWKEGAKRANASVPYRTRFQDETRLFVEALLDQDEGTRPHDSFAHRMLVTANPAYDAAFGRWVMGRESNTDMGLIRMAVSNTGLGSETPVPVTIDPTVLYTGDGARSPLRQLAQVVTITGLTWRGIGSDGVTLSYGTETAAITPGTPSFDAPDVSVVPARGEIQFTVDVDDDWPTLRAELQRMFAMAKFMLEADKFLNGSGTDEPMGLVTALYNDATSVIETGSAHAIALTDVSAVSDDLPSAFDYNATWLAHKAFYSSIAALAGAAGRIDVWVPLTAGFNQRSGQTGYALLGSPAATASEMSKLFTTGGEDVAIIGDFAQGFVIVDRVGLNVELDLHPRDTNGKWTGNRGLLCWFRNNTAVRTVNAFRMLQVART